MASGSPALGVDRRLTSLRTAGATSVPNSSMARITFSCGSVPTLICAIKRLWPKSSCSKSIFCTTSPGLPTTSAPWGERPISMVLADAEDVEAELICQLDLLEEIVQPPRRVDLGADVGEGVKAEFHRRFLSGRVRCARTSEAV